MPQDKYSAHDLVLHAMDQQPLEFAAAFDALIKDRLSDVVDIWKQDVAKQMFAPQVEQQPEIEDGETA